MYVTPQGAKWSVLLTQYCAGDKIEKNEMGWACGAYGWGDGAYRILEGKPEGKRPLGRPRRRWVEIRMDLQEVGCGYMDWIGLAQDRDGWRTLVSAVMSLRVPWNAGNFLTSCKPVSFSRTLHHGVSKYLVPNNQTDINRRYGVTCWLRNSWMMEVAGPSEAVVHTHHPARCQTV